MNLLKELYKRTVTAITVPVLERILRFVDGRSWVPVVYFNLCKQNTTAFYVLHALHNIQVKTGRKIIVLTAWPFWPRETARDPLFTSFIQGLNPKIRYVWISDRLERLINRVIGQLYRFFQIQKVLHRPMGLQSTVRLDRTSTLDHIDLANCSLIVDLLNRGSRVVCNIPRAHEDVLEEKLKALGISPDDWFVCTHAREPGFSEWSRDVDPSQSSHRNVDIQDYFPAIEHIRSEGGWIVRMGDPTMTRVRGIDGLIDYPFTEHKSMLMDLFLVSRCRFVLGCGSGLSTAFPPTFGTPVIITNEAVAPAASIHFPYDNMIFLPKRIMEKESGRILGLQEMFHPSIPTGDNNPIFEAAGYRWISNTPEDILEATKEMLHLVETDSFGCERTREQELFHQYRLDALKALWESSERRKDANFSELCSAESRISAPFAARYFRDAVLDSVGRISEPIACQETLAESR